MSTKSLHLRENRDLEKSWCREVKGFEEEDIVESVKSGWNGETKVGFERSKDRGLGVMWRRRKEETFRQRAFRRVEHASHRDRQFESLGAVNRTITNIVFQGQLSAPAFACVLQKGSRGRLTRT